RSTSGLPIFERREPQGKARHAAIVRFVASAPGNVGLNSSREPDAVQEILKPSVGSERIEGRPQQDGGIESRLIGLVQPDHRLVVVAEAHVDQGNIRIRSGALALQGLQVLGYFHRLVLPSRNGVSISEIGVEYRTASGKLDCSLKLRDCFLVHVLLLERLAKLIMC